MPHLPFSQPWADAFRAAINADDAYRAVGTRWSAPLALVLAARPELGWPEDAAIELQLAAGRCDAARAVAGADVGAPFALRGDYDTWKRVVRGELDPVQAAMTGKLALVRGSLGALMLHVPWARALLACARAVPTRYPDEEATA